jgi:hypothetical protein
MSFRFEICASEQQRRSFIMCVLISRRAAQAGHASLDELFWQERRRESHGELSCAFDARKIEEVNRVGKRRKSRL